MEAPQWLTEGFLKQIPVPEIGNYVNLTLKDVERAVAKGDNFMSIIYRAKVEYVKEDKRIIEKSFIIKAMPDDPMVQQFIQATGAFERETRAYKDALPLIHDILRKENHNIQLNPNFYKSPSEGFLIFEDLKSLGYKMVDRRSLLDREHCSVVLRTLASLHAASLALLQTNPSLFDPYTEPVYVEEKREFVKNITGSFFGPLVGIINEWKDLESIAQAIKGASENLVDFLIEVVKPSVKFPSVFCHGDCWKNNIMFKYDEETGKVESAIFVDFQQSKFSSPALDVLYFLYTSVQDEVLETRDSLLAEYHEALIENLKSLGCYKNFKYTFEDMKEDVQNRLIWALYVTCSLRATVLMEKDKTMDTSEALEMMQGGDEKVLLMNFVSEEYKTSIKNILLHLEKYGLLDCFTKKD